MKKILKFTLLISSLILLISNTAFALDISLAWDASPEPDIAGYKLYYQADSATLPFEGFEAIEGNSPIDVGDVTSFSLTGLPDGRVYYFAVNAYNESGAESAFSNIVASDWVPELIAPVHGSTDEPTTQTFIWSAAPLDYDVTYTLYFSNNPEFKTAAISTPGAWPGAGLQPTTMLSWLIVLSLIIILFNSNKKTVGAITLVMGLTLAGCGGGDGGLNSGILTDSGAIQSPSDSQSLPDGPTVSGLMTSIVPKGRVTYHEVYDLEPSTTYYWKVVASDASDPTLRYESQTKTFTTTAN